MQGGSWDLEATNRMLHDRGNIKAMGLVGDLGSPGLQNLSNSIHNDHFPNLLQIKKMQADVQTGK